MTPHLKYRDSGWAGMCTGWPDTESSMSVYYVKDRSRGRGCGSVWSRSGANLKSQYSCGAQNGTILTHVNPRSRYQVYSLSRGFPGKGIRARYRYITLVTRRTGILQDHIWAGNRRVTDSGEFLLNMKRVYLGHILFVCFFVSPACGRSKHANTGFINCALFCTR